jgi:hypothetical protein
MDYLCGSRAGGDSPLGTSSSRRCGEGWGVEVFEAEEAEVDLGVVVAAEETEIVDDGFATGFPGDDVMDVAPFGGTSTA